MEDKKLNQILVRIQEESVEDKRNRRLAALNAIKTSREIIEKQNVIGVLPDPFSGILEEICTMISLQLLEQPDANNCSLVCPEFQAFARRSGNYCQFFAIFSLIAKHYLSKKDILSCRQVCKRWLADVDRCLEKPDEGRTSSYFYKSIVFPLNPKQQNTLAAMAKHSRNPFVGRRLGFVTNAHYSTETRNQIINWLRQFGKHVHFLEVMFMFENISQENANELVKEIFANCTNLKSFTASGVMEFTDVFANNNVSPVLLPDNVNLKNMVIYTGSMSQLYYEAILSKYRNQITSLEIEALDKDPHLNLEWQNVENLWLEEITCESTLRNMGGFQAPKLKRLSIGCTESTMNVVDLIRFTGRFPLLKRICLELGVKNSLILSENQIREIAELHKLCNTSVEMVELRMRQLCYLASFDFLLFFPNLKTLVIYIFDDPGSQETAEENGLVIKLIDRLIRIGHPSRPVLTSNVWQKCKRLNTLLVYWNNSKRTA